MISIIIILSFYLEGILSKINISILSTISSLIIIYPYLYNNKKSYYKICFILGILYDITYTDTIFLNAFIFLLIGFIIIKLNNFLTNNILNISIITIIIIIIYRIVTYIILLFINYINFNNGDIIYSIINSLYTIIYSILLFKTTDIISNKRRISRFY